MTLPTPPRTLPNRPPRTPPLAPEDLPSEADEVPGAQHEHEGEDPVDRVDRVWHGDTRRQEEMIDPREEEGPQRAPADDREDVPERGVSPPPVEQAEGEERRGLRHQHQRERQPDDLLIFRNFTTERQRMRKSTG